jgi:hypothetical protein
LLRILTPAAAVELMLERIRGAAPRWAAVEHVPAQALFRGQ